MTEIIMVKRVARAGEMGLFVESPIWEDEFSVLKIGSEVKVIATTPGNLKYVRFFHALAGKVADNCSYFVDKDDAKKQILLDARHFKIVQEPLSGRTEIKAKSVAGLSGDEWIRLLRRCTHVVITKFLPGMDENVLRAEIEAMIFDPISLPEPAKPAPKRRGRPPLKKISVLPDDEPQPPDDPAQDPAQRKEAHETEAPQGQPASSVAAVAPATVVFYDQGFNVKDWSEWTEAWLRAALINMNMTAEQVMIRWCDEKKLREACGVTSEALSPMFDLYRAIIERMRNRRK
jgi:hypothetical protein